MDLGWAERVSVPVRAVAQAFVDDAARPFAAAVMQFVAGTRMVLTELEFHERLYSNAKFVLLEHGATQLQVARIGGLQVLVRPRGGDVVRVGTEDVVSLTPDGPPVIATACLIPNLRWKASNDAAGWAIEDESEKAARFAEQVRKETWDRSAGDATIVLTHPFWTRVDSARLASLASEAAIEDALRTMVSEAAPRSNDALAVLCAGQKSEAAPRQSGQEDRPS